MTMDNDRSVLAGELALEILDGDDRAAAFRLMLSDPDFARAVEMWRRHFATLFDQWPAAEPSPGLEARVLAANDDSRVGRSGVAPAWRWLAGATTLAAACLTLALVVRPERVVMLPAPPVARVAPPLVAAMTPAGDNPAVGKPFGAVFDAGKGQVRLAGAVTVPQGRTAQLWAIGGDGVPRPLGLIAGAGASSVTIAGPNRAQLAAGTTLAISVEPAGGSPTGLPTGPVVATGVLAVL